MGRPSTYSREFREQAVGLVKANGATVAQVDDHTRIADAEVLDDEKGSTCAASCPARP